MSDNGLNNGWTNQLTNNLNNNRLLDPNNQLNHLNSELIASNLTNLNQMNNANLYAADSNDSNDDDSRDSLRGSSSEINLNGDGKNFFYK